METGLRSTLQELALAYAQEIVAAVRSAPIRELFEPPRHDDAGTTAERFSRAAAALVVTYGLSDAEADVLYRAAQGLLRARRSAASATGTKLEKRVARLRRLAAKPPDDSTRYAIGAVIKELKSDPESFGDNAVRAAASAIGEDQATLYRFASVAERWSASQVRALLSGGGLSWSHLVALARVEPSSLRKRLMSEVLRKRLGMRAFQVLLSRAMK